ncbi:alpha/beta hydrolase [Chitinophaga pendula]|uniref:alpha/beta fold hydrolase n=1 Tax=Chitinophaga TaxID=79328 RepID=UPI000BAECFF0|nr:MULTISPECIES: alpha/beta hydrolase [Chitinophaga]ASZ12343.1 hypothetical protein CK934_15930 [Chitinophaga sp. MD30]UCJ10063.1 alpha/beta hydrolase [Chitinophaga pendula]
MQKVTHLLALLLFCALSAHSQQLDSIPYAYGKLYYHIYGKGTPVILLSGGPGNACQQQATVAEALGKKYLAILLEQRGTGLSIPTPLDSTTINLKAAEDDITLLMDHLKIKKSVIYGHSWGAMLALSYATKHPERVKALVLACPGYYTLSTTLLTRHVNNLRVRMSVSDLALFDALEKKISTGKANAADSTLYARTSRLGYIYDKSRIDTLFAQINTGKPNLVTQGLIVKDLGRVGYDLSKTLPKYKGRIDVISGAQDALAFYTYEFKVIQPSMRLHWIERSGHFPMFEQPVAFLQELDNVLQTH